MLPKQQRPVGPRHVSAASVDTNASAMAESTISLGLSRFPEPPSSIPSTSPRGNVCSPSSSIGTFNTVAPLTFPLRPNSKLQDNPAQPSSSSHILSPYDWHEGASSIDVDAAEDRLLPTSFITSLLQENVDFRKSKRNSHVSETFSSISEMTYPPIISRPLNGYITSSFRNSPQRRLQQSKAPPSAYPQPVASSNRVSTDSETLHSNQDYPAISRAINSSRIGKAARVPIVGVAPATLRSISSCSQISSMQDSDTIGSVTKGYQTKLSTTYETGHELPVDNQNIPALPSKGSQKGFLQETSRRNPLVRQSFHSHQSAAPSFISRVSELSYRIFNWKKAEPLPPVPINPQIPLEVEQPYRNKEQSTLLPDLVDRAGVLRDLLDHGQYPHNSLSAYQSLPVGVDPLIDKQQPTDQDTPYISKKAHLSPLHKKQPTDIYYQHPQKGPHRTSTWRKVVLSIVAILVIGAISVALGFTVGRKKSSQFNCAANLTGSFCNIGNADSFVFVCVADSTCVCTSTSGCNALARSILGLLPTVNRAFSVNISSAAAYSSIWLMQGSPSTRSCTDQALLIDLGKNLDPASFPNRVEWAQAALLWNAIQTQDINSVQQLQLRVQTLPWSIIGSTDGPVSPAATFAITSSGFTYNFASQTLSQASASFVTLGRPSTAQISQVNSAGTAALDRMYSYAQASATQRQVALKNYWTSVLLQDANDLPIFKSAISMSPIMLPFNASSPQIRNLYGLSATTPFPPPLSCFPGLNSDLLQEISAVESTVFSLPDAVPATQFDPACYSGRPVYGVLNILRLRLPFLDSQPDVNRQAVTLSQDAASRAVICNGQLFNSVSLNTTKPLSSTPFQSDPRQYGTLTLSDHVILEYLSSIADITVATALVKFVLATMNKGPVPPDASSHLYRSLASMPMLSIAVFGAIRRSDLTSTVSPFTTPSDSLFFGSPDGTVLRNWAINSSIGSILWTQNATSPLIVHDQSLDSSATISTIWNVTSQAILFNITSVSLTNVTASLQATKSFSPQ
ncbi:hypothetical protein BDN70DRAFT_818910 [Pholiota conissans]|uniref:Transmembrane protein n=1 Tax=Pholiota conissans TaxID=109636 RepID=A0A9P5YRA8_9AGAR|nr:hypothetical protein BDN70DRAFT_818910 [Pholiota conissans]